MRKIIYIVLLFSFIGSAQGIVNLDKLRQQQVNDNSSVNNVINEYTEASAVNPYNETNSIGSWAGATVSTTSNTGSYSLDTTASYRIIYNHTVLNGDNLTVTFKVFPEAAGGSVRIYGLTGGTVTTTIPTANVWQDVVITGVTSGTSLTCIVYEPNSGKTYLDELIIEKN